MKAAVVSLVTLAALLVVVARMQRDGGTVLVARVAASQRAVLEPAAAEYKRRTGRRVELAYGASQDLLTQIERNAAVAPADVFLPADASYLDAKPDLVAERFPIGRMSAAVLVANGRTIRSWEELTRDGVKIAIGNPDAAAIGKLTKERLTAKGLWPSLERRIAVATGNVTESANAAKLGAVDAAIVWHPMKAQYPTLQMVRMAELEDVIAIIEVATLRQSRRPDDAVRFARFLTSPDGGLKFFREAGLEVP